MQLGELRHERQPHPRPAGSGARPLHERVEDPVPVLRREPRPVVLDDDEGPSSVRSTRIRDPGVAGRVLDGVGEQVLDDPLHHRRVRLDVHRAGVELQPALGHGLGPRHELANEGTQVDGPEPRHEALPLEAIQVQQVRDDPIEPTGVLHDPRGEVADVLGRHVVRLVLEGDREAQDRGERRPDVVRDRLHRDRLGLVGGGQAQALLPLAGELVAELVHPAAVRDVDEHPQPVARHALAVRDQPGAIVQPDRASILREDAVLDASGEPSRPVGGVEPVRVLRVHELRPRIRVGVPLLRRVAEDRRGLLADRQRLLGTVDRVEVGDRGDLLLERAEPFLRLHPP